MDRSETKIQWNISSISINIIDMIDDVADPSFLRTFLVVCESGSFSAAAERLHRTQPAVSYQMRTLEREVGATLFERLGRGVEPTPEGRALHGFCARYFGELTDLLADVREGGPERCGELRIGSVSGFGRYVLFPILVAPPFDARPVSLAYRTAATVFERLETGADEVGFSYRAKTTARLRFEPVYREELVLVRAPSSPADPVSPSSLEGTPFLTYEEGDYVFGKWFDACLGARPGTVSSVSHFDELEEVVGMAAAGRGVSIVPEDCAREAVEAGELEVVRPGGERCWNTVYAVTRAGDYRRPVVSRLITAVRACEDPSCGGPGAAL